MKKSLECEYRIVISSLVLKELKLNGFSDEIWEFKLKGAGKLVYTEDEDEDKVLARIISAKEKTPYHDTLHAVIANRMKAFLFVTRNMKDYVKLQHLVELHYPENL